MKLSSCSLPQLSQRDTGVNATSGDKQTFSIRLAAGNNMASTLPQAPSVAPMTTTFRESYRGLYGPPAPSTRRKQALPGPYRLGSSSYSVDFCPRPLRKRTPPRVREGNVLNSYPGNVLYPYKLPEQVITVWKPFPVQQSDSEQTEEILARLASKMYRTSYQTDFTK
ncbi:hypothetical protein ACROYT_G018356 [Oculina patagonica]